MVTSLLVNVGHAALAADFKVMSNSNSNPPLYPSGLVLSSHDVQIGLCTQASPRAGKPVGTVSGSIWNGPFTSAGVIGHDSENTVPSEFSRVTPKAATNRYPLGSRIKFSSSGGEFEIDPLVDSYCVSVHSTGSGAAVDVVVVVATVVVGDVVAELVGVVVCEEVTVVVLDVVAVVVAVLVAEDVTVVVGVDVAVLVPVVVLDDVAVLVAVVVVVSEVVAVLVGVVVGVVIRQDKPKLPLPCTMPPKSRQIARVMHSSFSSVRLFLHTKQFPVPLFGHSNSQL